MTPTIAALAAVSLAVALPVQGTSSPFPSAEQTRAEFDAVCQRQRQSDNPFFGEAMLERYRQRLATPTDVPRLHLEARASLGYELIRLGRQQEALTELGRVRTELDAMGGGPPAFRRSVIGLIGIAHFQLGENANCIAMHNEASCILPIREGAIHADPEHVRIAGDRFLEVLEISPDDVNSQWMLNLSRMLSGDYPEGVPEPLRLPQRALEPPPGTEGLPLFTDWAPRLGVDVLDLAGGGVVDDFDGDGRLDLVSTTWDPCAPMKAFRNDGEGGFEDTTVAWGLDAQLGGLNLVHADFDGDGRLDLLVLRGAWFGEGGRVRNSLLRNELDGDAGRFVDVTAAAGIAYPAYPTQGAAWADFDLDGDLDLFVANEATFVVVDPTEARSQIESGYPNQLFRNNGDGTFVDVARTAGVADRGFGKGAAWGDYDDDGDPDLYVSNLGANRLYRNDGDGRFTDVTAEAGVGGGERGTFATWFFDYDNDGDLDLFVAAFNAPPAATASHLLGLEWERAEQQRSDPFLFRNEGDGRFTDVSSEVGFGAPLLVMGANYGDIDGDGWLDLYLGTGQPDLSAIFPNVLYRNVQGRRFVDATFATGLGHLQKGHAVAFGDVDGDGDEEIFQQLGGAYPYDTYGNAFYPNPGTGHRWIVLRLAGASANRFGVGARIRVEVETAAGERRLIHRSVDAGGSFGGSSLQAEIGLGNAARVLAVEVRWPASGAVTRSSAVALDRYYRVDEAAGAFEAIEFEVVPFRLRPPRAQHAHP
ncbi:MAG TPA: CRTAC1 family protein [Thermoanaerobaculia bacterium]|nr:CRTAC1 family protein [Thermoanaerobaculia bacterium]